MVQSFDEVSTEYGLLAEAVRHPPDFSSVTYGCARRRALAAVAITPEDVVWSFGMLRKRDSGQAFFYRKS